MAFRHPSQFCVSFGSSWCCFESLRTRSIHLSLGLPRGLFPPTFIVVTCFATFVSSLLITWPFHESRFWVTHTHTRTHAHTRTHVRTHTHTHTHTSIYIIQFLHAENISLTPPRARHPTLRKLLWRRLVTLMSACSGRNYNLLRINVVFWHIFARDSAPGG